MVTGVVRPWSMTSQPTAPMSGPVPVSATESVRVDLAGLAPGHYTLRASVDWQQHKPGLPTRWTTPLSLIHI